MRAKRRAAQLVGLTATALVITFVAPGVASESQVSIGGFKFSPSTVTIQQGDTVTWSWTGPDKNHTVTSNSGQADSFESHPGIPPSQIAGPPAGGTYSHIFNTPGTFTYFCRVHPFIRGTVVVNARPPPPPPPVSQQAVPVGLQPPQPSIKECLSRRNFKIRIREPRGVRLASAKVLVNGKPVSVQAANETGRRRLSAQVDLRGLPKGQYEVQITARTADGRILHGKRRYLTCAPKLSSAGLPRL